VQYSRRQDEIWVTGIGCVSAAGFGSTPLVDLLESGRSGIRHDPTIGTAAGTGPDPPRLRFLKHLDRTAQYFALAAEEAWSTAGLNTAQHPPRNVAIIEGSSLGSMADLLGVTGVDQAKPSPRQTHATHLVRYMPDAGAMAFAQAHGIEGPVYAISAGSVSGALAIAQGCQQLASGEVDIVVAGGSDCPLHPSIVDTFRAAGVLSDPSSCRPFDRQRAGTVLGEGSGVVILERAGSARNRRGLALARILGMGQYTEHTGRTAPRPDGAGIVGAIQRALQTIGNVPVGWIKTHGTGTRAGDAAELCALRVVFGDLLATLPLTSVKSSLGHSLGGSGALETVVAILALQRQFIPATLEHDELDPDSPVCRVNRTVCAAPAGAVLVLAESFGGRCTALVLAPSQDGRRQ
jgi:3-oxoacyl-[acyl-carrier-protein] synthase II